ncbi:MAG: transglutaminase-like domain-containing protein [Pseudomonadota bacterium]
MALDPDRRAAFVAALDETAGEVDLVRAALLIAAQGRGVDVAGAEARVQTLIAQADATGCDSLPALAAFLRDQAGFSGNAENYYDADNSYLDLVLERRVGIPITLAVLHIAVGEGLGLDVRGIGFPGHFLVAEYGGRDSGDEIALVDPFAGRAMSRDDARALLVTLYGDERAAEVGRDPALFAPCTSRDILLRMLENLKQLRARDGDLGGTLALLELQLVVRPEQFELRAQHESLLKRAFGGLGDGDAPAVH